MRRMDTCWFCGKENIECDITKLTTTGKEIACCDKCNEEIKRDAEYINPMDLV